MSDGLTLPTLPASAVDAGSIGNETARPTVTNSHNNETAMPADELFRRLDREVWLVTVRHDSRCGGLIATSVMQASIVPTAPRVVVGIAKQHATRELIEAANAFTLQLLPQSRIDLVECFGMQSSRDVDKFAADAWSDKLAGGPLLLSAVGWLDCRVEACWDSGDRSFYLSEVTTAQAPSPETEIMTVQQLIADTSPDRLRHMKEQVAADAERDAASIAAWRAARADTERPT